MKQSALKYYFSWLQEENYKSFYLAFLRVGISLWLLKEVCINWPNMDILYGQAAFVEFRTTLLNRLPGGIAFVRQYYRWFIIAYLLIIALNIAGIGRWITAIFLFLMVYVLQQMNFAILNGGDIMVRLILLYLIFADSYQYFVVVKKKNVDDDRRKLANLVSNLAAVSLMLQLCTAYFLSGLDKLNDTYWLNGEGTYYALSMERFIGTPLNKYIVQYKWINLVSNYATLAFELFFPLLIWIKKFRKPLLIAGLIFHLSIYIFMMLYGFEIVFILMLGLFLPNDQLVHLYQKWKSFFFPKKIIANSIPGV